MAWHGYIAAIAASAASLHVMAQEPLDALVAPLLKAQTYCESGTWGASVAPDIPLSKNTYRVCAHRDGRFRSDVAPGRPEQLTIWSDGRRVHRYVPYSRAYQSHELGGIDAEHIYEKPVVSAPALHSRLIRWMVRGGPSSEPADALRDYRVSPGLSDERRTVHERISRNGHTASRIVVTDGALRRLEDYYDGRLTGYVEVASRELDRTLAESELAYDLPLLVRVLPGNNLAAFLGIVFAAVVLPAFGLWMHCFARATDPFDVVRLRARLWRAFARAFAATAVALGLLAALTWGGSGHPPAIAYVTIMAFWAAVAFGLLAGVLLASYPAQRMARHMRGTDEPA